MHDVTELMEERADFLEAEQRWVALGRLIEVRHHCGDRLLPVWLEGRPLQDREASSVAELAVTREQVEVELAEELA
jgi:hypothetical protein